jgi:ribonuclease R
MLAANEAVAKHTKDKLKPSIYRAHEDPDADKLFEFRQLAMDYGINTGDLGNRGEIQKLLAAARGRPEEHAIKVGLLKSLKRATYANEPIGHYGLAKVNYTHFTSPIRRYADLIVHRILAAITGNAPAKTPPLGKLEELAGHLSDTERNSSDAEFETQKLKQIEYLWHEAKRSSQKNPVTHPAMIHEVRRKGLFVELTDFFIKGLVTEADLPHCKGGYWFDGAMARFIGSKPKRVFQAGDTVQVAVSRVDFQRRMVDFKIIE